MQRTPSKAHSLLNQLKHYKLSMLMLAGGFLLSLGLSMWVAHQVNNKIEARFQNLAQRQIERISDRLEHFQYVLKETRELFLQQPAQVDTEEFRRHINANKLIEKFPGILALTYIERVPVNGFAAAVKHLPNYHRIDTQTMPPKGQEAWVVRLAEPENSKMLQGLDISSESRREVAARSAMKTGNLSLSAPVTLLQDSRAGLQGVIFFLPVYQDQIKAAHHDAAQLVGWLEAVLRTDDVMRFLGNDPAITHAIDIAISDVTSKREKIYQLPLEDTSTAPLQHPEFQLTSRPILQLKQDIDIGGRRWEIQVAARPGLYSSADRLLPTLTLGVGILISMVVAGLLALSASLRLLAEERTMAITASLREREELLQSTLSSLNDWVFVLDTKGYVIDCHEPSENMWHAHGDFINHAFAAALPPDAASEFTQKLQSVRSDGHARFEFSLQGRSQTNYFIARLSARNNSAGQFDGVTVVAHDITDERAQGRELHESDKKLRLLFAEAAQAIILTCHDHYVDANPAALRLFGIPNLAALQYANMGVVSPLMQPDGHLSHEATKDIMQRALNEGPQHFEWTFQRLSDGESFPCEVHCNHIDINGKAHFLSIITDLSSHKQLEHSLIQARNAAEAVAREKSDFLATMSHEIRTPMNGVLGMAQLLANTQLNTEQHEYINTILQSGQTLLAIINDILDFSKLETGKLSFDEVPFDLQVVMDETLELLLPKIHEKNLTLNINLEPGTVFHVVGDPGRFRQILLNYLGNALKFTQSGSITVALRMLESGRGAAFYELSVSDTGIGISTEQQGILFRKFEQADSSSSRRFGGSGLGLAICKALVERMGGSVSVSSDQGSGSTFRATFWMSLDPHTGHQLLPVMLPALQGAPILLLDANTESRDMLLKGLNKAGLIATGARTIAEAVCIALEQKPRYVLLDANFPDADTASLLQTLRLDGSLADATIILLSSRPERDDHGFCIAYRIAAHLPKPARLVWILSCLNILATGDHEGIVTRHTLSTHHARGKALPGLRPGIRVLLTEDNAVNQKVAARMLEKMGCHVDLAGNGIEALLMLAQLPYDVVLMDVQMPEMDGITATRNLRAQGFATLPVIALTANNRESDRQECRAVGMSDFLAKPIRYEDLHACLSRWV